MHAGKATSSSNVWIKSLLCTAPGYMMLVNIIIVRLNTDRVTLQEFCGEFITKDIEVLKYQITLAVRCYLACL